MESITTKHMLPEIVGLFDKIDTDCSGEIHIQEPGFVRLVLARLSGLPGAPKPGSWSQSLSPKNKGSPRNPYNSLGKSKATRGLAAPDRD